MGLREVGGLIGLGALGGAWTVAWAARRAQRPQRAAMLDARTQVQVRLDALRARTAALARHELPAEARTLVDEVVEQQVLIDAVLSRAFTAQDVLDLDGEIADAFMTIQEAATLIGEDMPADTPYSGLCGVDPSHGPARTRTGTGDTALAVCGDCAAAASVDALPARRQVTIGGRPVPFDDDALTEELESP